MDREPAFGLSLQISVSSHPWVANGFSRLVKFVPAACSRAVHGPGRIPCEGKNGSLGILIRKLADMLRSASVRARS